MESLHIIEEIVELPPSTNGVVVECGSFMGGSSSKLSRAAAVAGRKLVVCDSFEGLPEVSADDHVHSKRDFRRGEYAGRLEQVRANVARYGHPQVVQYVVGWFDKSLSELSGTPIACAFWDVDLQDSFRACIRSLWNNVQPGSKVFIHDIDRQPVVDAFVNPAWWQQYMDAEPPQLVGALTGLGRTSSLIGYALKPA
jgi:predicted O-methyltransferase YrrM